MSKSNPLYEVFDTDFHDKAAREIKRSDTWEDLSHADTDNTWIADKNEYRQ